MMMICSASKLSLKWTKENKPKFILKLDNYAKFILKLNKYNSLIYFNIYLNDFFI
jgi:hypothetical protein